MNIKSKIIVPVVIVIILLIVLPGLYLGGNNLLANAIKSSYQNRDCEQVVSQANSYTNIYPTSIADPSLASLVSECGLYFLALEDEQKEDWQSAYNNYQTYSQTYPQGLFVAEAEEHSALALTSQAKEQLAAKKYSNALENAQRVLENFAKTTAAQDATSLISETYTTWAGDQHDSSDFAGAEETLKTFQSWAESTNRPEDAKSAQRQLAQTYLDWGLAFQEQKQFENAKAKFDLASSTDPEPLAQSGPTAQTKTMLAALDIEWGDALFDQNDLTGAMDHYQTALPLFTDESQAAIQEKIIAVRLKQIISRTNNDFLGTLKQLEQIKKDAVSDKTKKDIETAQTDIYQAFSESTGDQAQQAMADAAKQVCIREQLTLPIFGTDSNTIQAYLYVPGSPINLTDKVKATTPASLHYVGCVTQSTESTSSKGTISKWWTGTAGNSYFTVEFVTISWTLKLYNLKTGELVASEVFGGSAPPGWEYVMQATNGYTKFVGDIYLTGNVPNLGKISEWVAKYMK